MTGELGQLAVCFALALSLVMAAAGLLGARADQAAARSIANGAAMGMFVFVALAFGVLTYAFVVSDFSNFLIVCEIFKNGAFLIVGSLRRRAPSTSK